MLLVLSNDNEADPIPQIPNSFEKELIREYKAELFLAINAINGVKANLGGAYLRSVINDLTQEALGMDPIA
ncbi:MAG: hypothetical protein U5K54_11615 [Cytophagales bacterium]|nr:hypothetical protein [Cytophagales bacterium]